MPAQPPRDFGPEMLEKYSSAITLSDMEIFVFPELLYSLVLANIMSPIVWAWREDPWFEKVEGKTSYRKVLRLKQFIMNNFDFNLDLDTWGLTDSEREIERFAPFIDIDIVRRSNALFGYEGDKYYFDMDIRRHFGLDKYRDSAIPYWKTETAEAMRAFHLRAGYQNGAGECVSLATLYAAALFVVCDVPLEDIFLMATPLHSQNFISVEDGILTNNRRIVTKNMLFNGSELTAKAQRALRNEQITIVAHNSGYIHVAYPEATIDPAAYARFEGEISKYLVADKIDYDILVNFLRHHRELQPCFQIAFERHGRPSYVEAEKVFHSEHSSRYRANTDTSQQLLEEMDEYEFYCTEIEGRITLNIYEQMLNNMNVDARKPETLRKFAEKIDCRNERSAEIAEKLLDFCRMEPRLPASDKIFRATEPIALKPGMERDEIVDYLLSIRAGEPIADLAFYAYRDMAICDWSPFLKAAVERNPVCREATKDLDAEQIYAELKSFAEDSIYDGTRVAQPDEAWNFRTADGLEKAICFASILKQREPDSEIYVCSAGDSVELHCADKLYRFASGKGLAVDLKI
jgi:hypothetical protein